MKGRYDRAYLVRLDFAGERGEIREAPARRSSARDRARTIPGYKGAELFVREAGNDEVEFITLLRFDTFDAVKTFAGRDYETPVIPPECKRLLRRHRERSRHYRVVPLN